MAISLIKETTSVVTCPHCLHTDTAVPIITNETVYYFCESACQARWFNLLVDKNRDLYIAFIETVPKKCRNANCALGCWPPGFTPSVWEVWEGYPEIH